MRAILKSINYDYRKDKDGNRERIVVFKCDFKDGETTKSLWGRYSEKFARDYFGYCGITTKELVGKEVDCIVGTYTDKEGKEKEFIKFLNVLDKNDKPIVMPKELDF